MKQRMNCKEAARLFMVFLVFSTYTLTGQVYEKSKHIDKAYAVEPMTEIQVNNKYGNVHLVTWEKDSVKFEIDVLVKANKQAKVDKIFEYIDFEFAATEYYVIVHTRFKDSRSKIWTEISDIAKTIFSTDNKAQIDYRIYLPASNPVKISNKFGNIYTTDHSGDLNVLVSNGDFKAHDLTGKTLIKVEFGSANLHFIKKGILTIDYSDLTLDEASDLTIRSKSSTLQLGDIKELELNTRRDKVYLNSANILNVDASFSYVNLKKLGNLMVSTTKYGEINVDTFQEGFEMFNCNSEYTDITINVPSSIPFDLEIDYNEKATLDYPATFENVKTTVKDTEEGEYMAFGFVGERVDGAARIDIHTRSGKVIIRQIK